MSGRKEWLKAGEISQREGSCQTAALLIGKLKTALTPGAPATVSQPLRGRDFIY